VAISAINNFTSYCYELTSKWDFDKIKKTKATVKNPEIS
jgi:hypothetical protein